MRSKVDVDGGFAEDVVRPPHTLVIPQRRVDPPTLAVLTDAVAAPRHSLVEMAGPASAIVLPEVGALDVGAGPCSKGRYGFR
jgi:D-arabinose 1-dehydrogenase-like Zn-dependent alcohol dehydrogenase